MYEMRYLCEVMLPNAFSEVMLTNAYSEVMLTNG